MDSPSDRILVSDKPLRRSSVATELPKRDAMLQSESPDETEYVMACRTTGHANAG